MDRTDDRDGGQSMNGDESGDDEDEGEDESECEDSDGQDKSEYDSQSSVAIEAGDLSDAESTPAWSLDNQEQLSQDPRGRHLTALLLLCYHRGL
jgi:hypothetical protein